MGSGRTPCRELAYESAETLIFGQAKRPVTCGFDVVIGGGQVLPEVNFTLPTMAIEEATIEQVTTRFKDIVTRILQRACDLGQEALVLEFEQLFELTRNPDWGARIVGEMKEVMADYHARHGLRSALRATIADIRDQERPPKMRSGEPYERVLEAFDRCAAAGADILSIESTGGKEVTDPALMQADIDGLVYGLGVLASADMEQLWSAITQIADQHGCVPGGDTACGFGNTAMQLAHQQLIPAVLAAVMRLMCAPRSLVAVESGARGPLKDCGYENPVLKAACGVPISMEGKSSACAHSSPVGNVAAAACDLWSNESVQDVRLLGGYAPESFAEVLVYDCRLMNTATADGHAGWLRDMLVASDVSRDPQAKVLEPAVMVEAARRIVAAGDDPYARTVAMAEYTVEVIRGAVAAGELTLSAREDKWCGMIEATVETLPDDPAELQARINVTYGDLYLPSEYGLSA